VGYCEHGNELPHSIKTGTIVADGYHKEDSTQRSWLAWSTEDVWNV
jgi:hypothetical protein